MESIHIDTLLAITDLHILRLYLQCMYPSNHSYTAEQLEQIRLHYGRLNGTAIDKDYAQRQIAMATILSMDETAFFEQLYDDRLPPFIRANRFDPDYTDGKPEQISSDLYTKRESLRYYSREMFIARTLNDVSYANYKTRKEAMHQIAEMEMDEFLTGLNEGTLPKYIPATYGDPDYCMLYRTPTFSNRNEFAYSIRGRLCTMSIDEFKTFISIDE
jgi:hypothetical protein